MKGTRAMQDLPLAELLQKVAEDEQLAGPLGSQLAAEAYRPAAQLLGLESEAAGALRLEASLGLMPLGYLAIRPLSELGPPAESFDQLGYIRRLGSLEEEARASVVEAVDALLEDRRPLPTTQEASAPVQSRVRDQAYLAMSQLILFAAEKEKSERQKFLAQPWRLRDKEIENRQQDPRWQAALASAPPKPTGSPPAERIGGGDAEAMRAAYRAELMAIKTGKSIETLQAKVDSDSMGRLFALLALSRREEPHINRAAKLVIRHLGDGLLLRPLLELGPPAAPEGRAEYVADLLLAEKQLRDLAVAALRKLLDDKRMVPQYKPEGPGQRKQIGYPTPEEAEEPRHVCDEAYLALSTIEHFADRERIREIKQLVVQASPELRDRLIARAKSDKNYEGPTEAEFYKDHQAMEAGTKD